MNIKEIASDVFYVGVNDRVTDRFEAMWPLPLGVSYNSYIVRGSDAVALIDTVEMSEAYDFFDNISSIIGQGSIDYLVVNHMEPDHSGAIPMVLSRYPSVRIVGNKQTVQMIKGFYHIDDDSRFLTVCDGESLSLGNYTLSFSLIPMVHWPETMVTYLAEKSILFSGDAFGTFGALCGGVVDSEMELDSFWPEMYRYYSNIVGKYGTHVQRALKKLAGLKLDYICSTHGPVWHEEIDRVVDIYNRLSLYQPEDGVVIIYGSMYGHTAKMAEAIASKLAEAGVRNIRMHNASKSNISYMISDAFRYKGLIVGAPTYSMSLFPPVAALMQALCVREIKNRVFATFGSFTWASATSKLLHARAEEMKMPVVADIEMKQDMEGACKLTLDGDSKQIPLRDAADAFVARFVEALKE